MKIGSAGLASILLAGLLVIGCSNSPTNPQTSSSLLEAQLAALSLSGELRPPAALSFRIGRDLKTIRSQFAQLYPAIGGIEFVPSWVAGEVLLSLNPATIQLLREGSYAEWNALNTTYSIASIDTNSIAFRFVVVRSNKLLHPCTMAESYSSLVGVTGAEASGRVGDGPNIYVRRIGSAITYLFRDAWGDCEAGCAEARYWYFASDAGALNLIGSWDPTEDIEAPVWWGDALLNLETSYGCRQPAGS